MTVKTIVIEARVSIMIPFYISGFGNPNVAICSIVKLDIFEIIRTQNALTYESYLCCLQ